MDKVFFNISADRSCTASSFFEGMTEVPEEKWSKSVRLAVCLFSAAASWMLVLRLFDLTIAA